MNRSVLARQMFAKGGAAFPDLSGDGKITQKDILMGRGVPMQEGGDPQMAQLQAQADAMGISVQELIARLQNPDMANYIDEGGELFYDPASGAASRRQMFDEAAAIAAKYQQPVGMAMGGDPAIAQGVGGMMPPDMAPPPSPMPQDQAIDPQVLESALSQAQENLGNIDEAEDYETVINSIRGDDAPISARYQELASVVGEEDAAQTPESVLTLVQPAMVMGAVDQGIGGLAQGAMAEPVQGAMAQGIMSTVEPPQPAMEAGGTPPVNFKEGGLVRRGDNQPVLKFAQAGVVPDPLAEMQTRIGNLGANLQRPTNAQRLRQLADQQKGIYAEYGLGDVDSRAQSLEEQKNLTQAQMLFDIANTALTYAAPMQGERPGMSAAERLAMAATSTQLPQTIGARAQKQLDIKREAEKEERALNLAALQSAETKLAAEVATRSARELAEFQADQKKQLKELELKKPKASKYVTVISRETGDPVKTFNTSVPSEDAELSQLLKSDPQDYYTGSPPAKKSENKIDFITNPERLQAYGLRKMGKEKPQFEARVLEFISGVDSVWSHELGTFVNGPKRQLPKSVLNFIEQGDPDFHNQVIELMGGVEKAKSEKKDSPEPRTLGDTTIEIFNQDGTVNLDSMAWSLTPPTRFNPDIDYKVVIGASRLYPGLAKGASEALSEMTGGDITQQAKDFSEAKKSLNALANDLLRFNTSAPQGGRVLKFVQELIEAETANIRPGGLFFKTDADAASSLKALQDGLILAIQTEAEILPEYGGSSYGQTTSQVTNARERLNGMKILLNEVIPFAKAFDYVPNKKRQKRRKDRTETDTSINTARDQLLKMRKDKDE